MSWPSDGKPRFVVTECEGWKTMRSDSSTRNNIGLACHVIDRAWNHRLVESFATENSTGNTMSHDQRRTSIRGRAATLADRLNAEECAA